MVRRLKAVQENARRLAHGLPLEPLPAGTDEIASLGSQLENAAYLLQERERELSESETALPRPVRPGARFLTKRPTGTARCAASTRPSALC